MIYLASPYSHQDERIREKRFKDVAKADLFLNSQGVASISPIAHWHVVAVENALSTDAATWSDINKRWVASCTKVAVLCLPGWDESVGVALELHWAKELDIPVVYLQPESYQKWVSQITGETKCH